MIIPKKKQSWLQRNVWYMVLGLVGIAVWWWFNEPTIMNHTPFGDITHIPRHLK